MTNNTINTPAALATQTGAGVASSQANPRTVRFDADAIAAGEQRAIVNEAIGFYLGGNNSAALAVLLRGGPEVITKFAASRKINWLDLGILADTAIREGKADAALLLHLEANPEPSATRLLNLATSNNRRDLIAPLTLAAQRLLQNTPHAALDAKVLIEVAQSGNATDIARLHDIGVLAYDPNVSVYGDTHRHLLGAAIKAGNLDTARAIIATLPDDKQGSYARLTIRRSCESGNNLPLNEFIPQAIKGADHATLVRLARDVGRIDFSEALKPHLRASRPVAEGAMQIHPPAI